MYQHARLPNCELAEDDIKSLLANMNCVNSGLSAIELDRLVSAFMLEKSCNGHVQVHQFLHWVFENHSARRPSYSQPAAPMPDASVAFQKLVAELTAEHLRNLAAVKSADETKASGHFRELVEQLVLQHEADLKQAAERIANSRRIISKDFYTETALWQIADEALPHADGPEHCELLHASDGLREQFDAAEGDMTRIKQDIKELEASMLRSMDELRRSDWGPMEVDLRQKLAGKMREMERKDVQLADLRNYQIHTLEKIRAGKIDTWQLLQADRVNLTVANLESSMRSGSANWWEGAERDVLAKVSEDLLAERVALDEVSSNTWDRVQVLMAEVSSLEAQQASTQHSCWEVDATEQELWLQIMRDTFELQVLAWRRNNMRKKQLHTLQQRWLLSRTQRMLQRQAEFDAAKAQGSTSLHSFGEMLEQLNAGIQQQVEQCKQSIGTVLQEAEVAQATLRSMKHIHNTESDAVRDQNMCLLFDVMVRDILLAWLRKEQLQTVELSGTMRSQLAEADMADFLRATS